MSNYILSALITILLALWQMPAIREKLFARVAKLPAWAQPLPPLVLGAIATLGSGWLDGLRGDALVETLRQNGSQVGLMAIAFWHIWKRTKGIKSTTVLVLIVSLSQYGCLKRFNAFATETWPVLCQSDLYQLPALKERARAKGIPLEELVRRTCEAEEIIVPLSTAVDKAIVESRKKALLDAL